VHVDGLAAREHVSQWRRELRDAQIGDARSQPGRDTDPRSSLWCREHAYAPQARAALQLDAFHICPGLSHGHGRTPCARLTALRMGRALARSPAARRGVPAPLLAADGGRPYDALADHTVAARHLPSRCLDPAANTAPFRKTSAWPPGLIGAL
jgi:hypothetical protein